jgi:hypothetical protein
MQHIPVFISCLQRIASIVLTLGFTLLLSGAYLRSTISLSSIHEPVLVWHHPHPLAPPKNNTPILVAFSAVYAVHLVLSLLHAAPILPRVGLHTAAYASVIAGLGSLFAGLGLWNVLS